MNPKLQLPRLRRDQWEIARHPAKVKVLAMGRRWGKTVLGGVVSLASASKGAKVAWVVPTYKNGRPLWRWADRHIAPLRQAGIVKTNKSERLIEFDNGGFLGIYSADNEDSIRGDWFNLVIIDEAARVKNSTWTDVIQPTLADKDGDAILISTPVGRNWFWYEYRAGLKDNEYIKSYNAPSANNPIIAKAAAKAQERVEQGRITERTYRLEWLAEFVKDGVFFKNISANLYKPDSSPNAHKGHKIVAGVDWGKKNDFTAISVICADCTKEIKIDRFNKIDYEYQKDRLIKIYNQWGIKTILAESNAMGEPLIDSLRRQKLKVNGFRTDSSSKKEIIESLALALEQNEYQWINDSDWTMELESYEIQVHHRTGRVSFSAPSGMHDDTVIARALALRAATSVATVMSAKDFMDRRR